MGNHSYENWNKRDESFEQIEPFRTYYFVCEGANTEVFYFNCLKENKRILGIKPIIDIQVDEREDPSLSHPKYLIEKSKEIKGRDDFDEDRDKIIVVFDADIYEKNKNDIGYNEIMTNAISENFLLGVTNPSFELYLLLHIENAYANHIKGKKSEIFKLVDNKYPYLNNEILQLTGMNPKKNKKIGTLAKDVHIAIEQEKFINRDPKIALGEVTSSIGAIVEEMINDEGLI